MEPVAVCKVVHVRRQEIAERQLGTVRVERLAGTAVRMDPSCDAEDLSETGVEVEVARTGSDPFERIPGAISLVLGGDGLGCRHRAFPASCVHDGGCLALF